MDSPILGPSTWKLNGVDQRGNNWIATLVFEGTSGGRLTGYFQWAGILGSGDELFEGTFDSNLRSIDIAGRKVQNKQGNVRTATYHAVLSPDGRSMINGRWFGGDSIPGNWTASMVDD